MDIRVRTAAVSTGLNFILTVLKFVLFSVTGSLAILAEAWHSFADVGTSLLVLMAVWRGDRTAADGDDDGTAEAGGEAEDGAEPVQPGLVGAVRRTLGHATAEHRAAFAIGLFLVLVSLVLLRKVVVSPPEVIEQPLLAGLLFLCFALGSYFVFRYETAVGRAEGSVALISDGLHSKADMIGALLAGSAMVLYSIGIDVDRPVALIISLFVLSFGVETLVTTAVALSHGSAELITRMRTIDIVLAVTDPARIKELLGRLEETTSFPVVERVRTLRRGGHLLRWPVLILFVAAYFSTCLYTVAPTEQAILLRAGRPVNRGAAIEPGLHLKLPWPIDRVLRVDAYRIRRRNIANTTDGMPFALLWTREHGTEEAFLSGDNNFFFPYLVFHYRVADVFDFALGHANPEELLDSLAHSLISNKFAGLSFDAIVGAQRSSLEEEIREEVQAELDELEVGIEILGVYFRDVHPPISIADAFERVIAARQEKQEQIDTAFGYRNRRLPETRGEAVRLVEGAHAYGLDRVRRAEGDGERFRSRVVRHPPARRVTARRLYLETMTTALERAAIVLVDPDSGSPTLFLADPEGGVSANDWSPLILGSDDPDEGQRGPKEGGLR